ncbi:ROK family protein [Streptomyces sp. M19]
MPHATSQRAVGPAAPGHEDLVLDLLRKHGPLSRAELGGLSGLSRTTLSDIVAALMETGAVVGSAPDPGRGGGRPVETLTLNPRRAGDRHRLRPARGPCGGGQRRARGDRFGQRAAPAELPWRERVALAERLVGTLAEGTLRLGALHAIGVGWSARSAPRRRRDADRRPVGAAAGAVPGAGAGGQQHPAGRARGGHLGAAAGDEDVLYLRLSHGVGGGLVVGGSLHRGAYGLSGEFGHITAESADGRCSCGGTGCLETVASVGAVLDAYRAAGGHADGLPRCAPRWSAATRWRCARWSWPAPGSARCSRPCATRSAPA